MYSLQKLKKNQYENSLSGYEKFIKYAKSGMFITILRESQQIMRFLEKNHSQMFCGRHIFVSLSSKK